MFEIQGKFTTAKVMVDEIDKETLSQIYEMVNHPAYTNPIAIMCDAHKGASCVVGFTMLLTDKVIPQTIGVDIACGIETVKFGELKIPLQDLDIQIREVIPLGPRIRNKPVINFERHIDWNALNDQGIKFWRSFQSRFNTNISYPEYSYDWLMKKLKQIDMDKVRFTNSIGTLGGGNHFISVDISSDGSHWLSIHTGSRNFGQKVCKYWQYKTKKFFKEKYVDARKNTVEDFKQRYVGDELMAKIKELPKFNISENSLWLEGEEMFGYLHDMFFAQKYAEWNRKAIVDSILVILKSEVKDHIKSIHNYIDFEDFIIRKGAIRSYENERMVVALNMRDGLLICTGKSNSEFNYSANHGAGRVKSRSAAKKELNLNDYVSQMKGIYSTSISLDTLDEAPDSYKDSMMIETAMQSIATIIDRIKPIYNLKDSSGEI